MAILHLVNLHCTETEDTSGGDECELRVWTDQNYSSFRRDMDDGEDWAINVELTFNSRAKIQLYDLDRPGFPTYDSHDWLGTHIVRATPVEGGEGTFNQDGADYTLTYNVKL